MTVSDEFTLLVPPNVVKHLLVAVRQEIIELERIGESCGDDWPSDYDPNDLAIYRGLRTWLSTGSAAGLTIGKNESLTSKPMEFLMLLVPRYVRNAKTTILDTESSEIFRTYVQYVSLASLERLPPILAHQYQHSSETSWITRKLRSLVTFPMPFDS